VVVPGGELGAADFQSVGRGVGGCSGIWEAKVEKENLQSAEATVTGGDKMRAIISESGVGQEQRMLGPVFRARQGPWDRSSSL
jgi:hypothetical protein